MGCGPLVEDEDGLGLMAQGQAVSLVEDEDGLRLIAQGQIRVLERQGHSLALYKAQQ